MCLFEKARFYKLLYENDLSWKAGSPISTELNGDCTDLCLISDVNWLDTMPIYTLKMAFDCGAETSSVNNENSGPRPNRPADNNNLNNVEAGGESLRK